MKLPVRNKLAKHYIYIFITQYHRLNVECLLYLLTMEVFNHRKKHMDEKMYPSVWEFR